MRTIETSWEDDENNRQVAFSVVVARIDDAIKIQSLTPKQVTFLCPKSNHPMRTIGVWTDKGRELLTGQFHKSGQMSRLEQQLDGSLAV